MKKGFDNQKYVKLQSENIRKRIKKFDKLYLEVGGKLFNDSHAARVLPGFKSDAKISMFKELKDDLEIIFCINANAIEKRKTRAEYGITYDIEILNIVQKAKSMGFSVNSVVVTLYDNQPSVDKFIKRLERNGIKTYCHKFTKGYPTDVDTIVSEEGYGANPYIETTKPLVIVNAPGPGSGKLATCLSQIYHENMRGVKAGYAKFETFPVWNLPLQHPVNLAYEAATVDLADVNMIDPYHLAAYGKTATNYNRDIETFPLLKTIFEKIYGSSPYQSPTDMGVNMVGFAIVNDKAACEASKQEIIRRYYQAKKNVFLGKFTDDTIVKEEALMGAVGVTTDDRPVIKACLEKAKKCKERVVAIELPNGKIITGKRSILLGAPAAMLLNTLKTLGKIDDSIHLISPHVVAPISDLQTGPLKKENPRIRSEEILIALAIQASSNPLAELALKQLGKLKGSEAHCSCILSDADLRTLNALGINVTEEPVGYAHKLYFQK